MGERYRALVAQFGIQQVEPGPIICLSSEDTETYAERLSDMMGPRYRLLSEAEKKPVGKPMPGNMSVETLEASRKLYIESWHKDGRLHGNIAVC